MRFASYEIGFVMLGAVTAEAAGRLTNGTYSWISAGIYLVIAGSWFAVAYLQKPKA